MKTIGQRVEQLEAVAGHCPACASARPVVIVKGPPRMRLGPQPEPATCARCGRDLTTVVEIELVPASGRASLEASR